MKVLFTTIICVSAAVGVGIWFNNFTPPHNVEPRSVRIYDDPFKCFNALGSMTKGMKTVDFGITGTPHYDDTYRYPTRKTFYYVDDIMVVGSCKRDWIITEYSYSEFVANMQEN